MFMSDEQKVLEASRPQIKFPDSFQIQITTNDYALNLTELVYFVSAFIFEPKIVKRALFGTLLSHETLRYSMLFV